MSTRAEEFEKWRPEVNSGEENSPILSQREKEDVATSISETATAMPALEGTSSFYITLAKESPQRIFEDSDESTYDSYHCRETDVCRDSTDLDDSDSGLSFHAIMEVVEYEVASINGDEALYSNDSSSGGDDFFFTTISTRSIRQLKSCNSDFADTEDSNTDNNYDPELSLADYWKCVKCKSKQNNPMFRYCEKCYQIRKSHFPPRPRKGNLKRKHNFSSSISEPVVRQNSGQVECGRQSVAMEERCRNEIGSVKHKFQTDTGHNKYKKRKFNYSTNSNSGEQNSNGSETSTENCSTESDTEVENITNSDRENRKRKISPRIKGNASHRNSNSSCSSNTKLNALNLSEDKAKTSILGIDDKLVNNVENKAFLSAIKYSDHENNSAQSSCTALLSRKDSGFSSVPSSSQEMPSSSSQSDDHQILTSNRYLKHDDDEDSDSTIIEDLNDKNMNEFHKKQLNLKLNNPLVESSDRSNQIQLNCVSRSYSDLNIEKVSSVKRSISNCSEILLNNNSQKNLNQNNLSSSHKLNINRSIETTETNNIDAAESDQCVVCLSEPKNGAFIHAKYAHICCCYRCAVKIWNTRKKCPICNCPVKNVLKLFVH